VNHSFPSPQSAQADLGCGKVLEDGLSESRLAKTTLNHMVAVYPNKCVDTPPHVPSK
jgi:hypothetical protein